MVTASSSAALFHLQTKDSGTPSRPGILRARYQEAAPRENPAKCRDYWQKARLSNCKNQSFLQRMATKFVQNESACLR
jgi:hypothetical protein